MNKKLVKELTKLSTKEITRIIDLASRHMKDEGIINYEQADQKLYKKMNVIKNLGWRFLK